ncbi:MAG: PEP-CTERM sorting domain-containing protein [Gammaproteobacteria bacterium]|nr:PEP-CTERM sorting domain-containing protein [Gammaproteobacteria bacterium]
MNLKGAMFGVMGLVASLSASAQTIDFGSFVLDFDDATIFGAPTVNLAGPGGLVSVSWSVPGSVNLAVNDSLDFVEFDLPSFTITSANGGHLSGPVTGLFGNLVFSEFGDSETTATLDGEVSLNNGAPVVMGGDMTRTITSSEPGVFTGGFYSAAASAPLGDFNALGFSNGHLALIVFGTGAILAQPQNEMRVSFFVAPAAVPVPTALWLFGSALGGLGLLRRRQA